MTTTILPVPFFQQSTTGYCLPACARMVLAYLEVEHTELEISKVLGTRKMGTPSFAIERLTAWGYQVEYRSWSPEELLPVLTQGQPMIVFVQTGFLDYWDENFAHAIVVVGATDNEQFWVHDPAQQQGPLKVSLNGLFAAWGEFDYKAAILQVMPQKRSGLSRALAWLRRRLKG